MVKSLFEGRRIGSRLAPSVFKFITGTGTTLRDLQVCCFMLCLSSSFATDKILYTCFVPETSSDFQSMRT